VKPVSQGAVMLVVSAGSVVIGGAGAVQCRQRMALFIECHRRIVTASLDARLDNFSEPFTGNYSQLLNTETSLDMWRGCMGFGNKRPTHFIAPSLQQLKNSLFNVIHPSLTWKTSRESKHSLTTVQVRMKLRARMRLRVGQKS
jgi:hypothetical protein